MGKDKNFVSEIDNLHYKVIRNSVFEFQIQSLEKISNPSRILDIAPQVHAGISDYAAGSHLVETLDISNEYSPTYVLDICTTTPIKSETFDVVFCTEVIEHVNNPFAAIDEIYRLLKPGGTLYATSPMNFRIHGPLPDNWRITEHGWRVLLSKFGKVQINAVEDPGRFLFPIHYRVEARK